MAHPQHDNVRALYSGRCGYCGVADIQSGGDHQIDHYQPLAAEGPDALENLVYACHRCNLNKGDFWPSSQDLKNGCRVLHPLLDVLSDHLQLDPATGLMEPLTSTGRFHIKRLRLNRPRLVSYRLHHHEVDMMRTRIVELEAYIRELQKYIRSQQEFIKKLKKEPGDKSESG